MRPLLQHEDVEFWQTDETQNTITTTNFYNDPNELLSESEVKFFSLFDSWYTIDLLLSQDEVFGDIFLNLISNHLFLLNHDRIIE